MIFSRIYGLLVLLLPIGAIAQTITIKDKWDGLGVEHVFIFDLDHQHSAMSDSAGKADLNEFANGSVLLLQHPAYTTDTLLKDEAFTGMKHYLEPKYIQLGKVDITGTVKVFNAVQPGTTISNEQISQAEAYNTPSALESTGQVFVQRSQFGGGSPNIRGFEASRVLLVVDGVRMNNAIYRSGHLQNTMTVDQFSLDKITVINGPSSTSFGSDALGGVVHMQTKKVPGVSSDSLVHQVNTIVRVASATGQRTMHLDYGIGQRKFGVLGSFTNTQFGDAYYIGGNGREAHPTHGRRDFYTIQVGGQDSLVTEPEDILHGLGYSQQDYLVKGRYQFNKQWTARLNLQGSSSGNIARYDQQNGTGTPEFARWDYGPQVRNMQSAALGYYSEAGLIDSVQITLSRQHIEESRITRRLFDNLQYTQAEALDLHQVNLGVYRSGTLDWYYGVDAAHNDLVSVGTVLDLETEKVTEATSRYPDGSNAYSQAGVFAQVAYQKGDHLFTAGGRYQLVKGASTFSDSLRSSIFEDGIAFLFGAPSGFFNWNLKREKWNTRAGLASGFRAPNIDDYGKIREKSGRLLMPGQQLEPEYVVSLDADVVYQPKDWVSVQVSTYYNRASNMLVTTDGQYQGNDSIEYNGQTLAVQHNQNIQTGHMAGLFARTTVAMGAHFELTSMMAFQMGRDLENDEPLGHIPPFYGRTALTYEWKEWKAKALARYQGWKSLESMSPSGVDNVEEATPEGFPAYTVFDVMLNREIKQQFTVQAGCNNVLNRRAVPFASATPMPGRNWLLTLSYRL